ncbi:serine hydrolase domain-containing protein [Jiangella asiatica]|uniref:Class A beta-lactamase-related serine hydrolase n=1 Tax=Jiangella asiatica TaxID=2530372 RepID=A0A4R5DG80_9ACTN|nr:serine hydrolase domain-containing protein [Jiangella asiatica]TDE12976.1 class A beta-lactamase-related serine hydrolase [Jiangella asiatica]
MILPATATDLTRRLAEEQSHSRLPSLAAGVVRDGELVWSAARGTIDGRETGRDADEHTQYRMGSITKTFVAVAIMRLRDEGKLDLADPVERHIPETTIGDVTIAQLLSHAAGVQAETDGPWWERTEGGPWRSLVNHLGRPLIAGRQFHYSNLGFGVLGELLTRLRGASWSHVVADELLEPLGMDRTTKRPVAPHAHGLAVHPFADVLLAEPEYDGGAMAPAGQLWSTVHDLARWAAFLGGRTGDLLAADTLAEMCRPLVVVDVPGAPWTGAHGLGVQLWNVDGRRFVGHGGSMPGFLAEVRVHIQTGDGVVVLTNATSGLSRGFATDLLDAYVCAEPRPPSVWRAGKVPASVFELVGHWYWGSTTFELRAMDDGWLRLAPASGAGRASRFRPDGRDRWIGLDGYYSGELLVAIRRPDGTVSHLDLASFRFTRTPYDPDADVPGGVDRSGWH